MKAAKSFDEIPTIPVDPGLKPTPRPRPANTPKMLLRAHEALGSIFRVKPPGSDRYVVYLNDADAIRIILEDDEKEYVKGPNTKLPFASIVPLHLIALDGPLHTTLRRAAVTGFSSSQLQNRVFPNVQKQALVLLSKWKQHLSMGTAVEDIGKHCRAFALDVMSEALFGEPWGAQSDYSKEGNPLAWALSALMVTLHWRVVDFSDRTWCLDSCAGEAQEILSILRTYVQGQIEEHRALLKAGTPIQDTLTVLLRHRTESGDTLDDEQLLNLTLTFLTMGHENMGSALAWTFVLLAENPDVQDNVRREACHAGHLTWEVLDSLPTLTRAFEEAVRLCPSVPAVTRAPIRKAGTVVLGYHIPVGEEIALNLHALNRLEGVAGTTPDSFCPARSYRGLSFGGGARTCLGRQVAYLEARVAVATVLRELELHPTEAVATSAEVFVSLRPRNAKLRVSKANESSMAKL